jgi:signal transduction histidine kinase
MSAPSHEPFAARPRARGGALAGITPRGVLVIAFVGLVLTLRRATYTGDDWLWHVGVRFLTVWILMAATTLAVVVTFNRVPPAARWRYAAVALAAIAATLAGLAVVGVIEARGWAAWRRGIDDADGFGWWLWAMLLGNGVFVLLCATVYGFVRVREEHEAATRAAALDRARSEREMDEARLAVLQAQIEPHFLFNTLANVRRLYDTDPAAGEAMLDNLMRYLKVALPQMRASESTLGREADLCESYLAIQRIRMGSRLAVAIDVPAALRDASVPPMLVLTLVENAIKHGVGPQRAGGSVHLTARRDGARLVLAVADSGQGFVRSSGAGTGLANTRARLAALHGDAAALALGFNEPHGVVATIVLPYAPLAMANVEAA